MVDVARLAGVHVSTVSRVLSGFQPVTDAVKRRVLDVAQALDYEVDANAQSLRSGRRRAVLVVLPSNLDAFGSLQCSGFVVVLASLSNELGQQGLDLLLACPEPGQERAAARGFFTGRFSAAILIRSVSALVREFERVGAPYLVLAEATQATDRPATEMSMQCADLVRQLVDRIQHRQFHAE